MWRKEVYLQYKLYKNKLLWPILPNDNAAAKKRLYSLYGYNSTQKNNEQRRYSNLTNKSIQPQRINTGK